MTIAGAVKFAETAAWPPDIARALASMALTAARPRSLASASATWGYTDDAIAALDGDVVLLFDGRLDNRAELRLLLDVAAADDAALALAAFRRWGDLFPDRLIGEFALALHDAGANRLLLARDPMSTVPLFFRYDERSALFATEPRGLFTDPDLAPAVDAGWIARWVMLLPEEGTASPYDGVHRVPPGHVAILDAGGLQLLRCWEPERLPPLRLPDDDAYPAAMLDLLQQAIRCRIDGARAVGSQLSGGLDSGTVTVLAAAELQARGQRITAFTAVPAAGFDVAARPDRIGDEGPLAAATASMHPNIEHVRIANGDGALLATMEALSLAAGHPGRNAFNHLWGDAISRAAAARGIDVLLTADAGNTTISYDGIGRLQRLARRFRLLTLAAEIWRLRRRSGIPLLRSMNRALGPALPPPLRRRVRAALGKPEPSLQQLSAIHPEFARRIGLAGRAARMAGNVEHEDPASDIRLRILRRTDPALFLRAMQRRFGVRLADPMRDRRVVEFCLTIPERQFLLGGVDRALLRRAMRDLLPPAVLNERRRGLQAADWRRTAGIAQSDLEAELERQKHSALACGMLDLERMERVLRSRPTRELDQTMLLRALAVGQFLRRFDGGNA